MGLRVLSLLIPGSCIYDQQYYVPIIDYSIPMVGPVIILWKTNAGPSLLKILIGSLMVTCLCTAKTPSAAFVLVTFP